MNEEVDIEDFVPWFVAFITFAGGCIRVLLLAVKGLTLDETVSIWLAGFPLHDIFHWAASVNQQPPLYYYLLHCWIALRSSFPYSVRFLSVLFGVAAIPVIYLIGKRLAGPVVGLVTAVLLAVSPLHIFYAQDASMVTLLMFNAAVTLYAVIRLVTDPRSKQPFGIQFREYMRAWWKPVPEDRNDQEKSEEIKKLIPRTKWRAFIARHQWLPIHSVSTDITWIIYVLFTALTLLSHNSGYLVFLTANLIVLGLILVQKLRKNPPLANLVAPSFWNWLIAQAVVLVLWIPWLVPFLQQTGSSSSRLALAVPTWPGVLGMVMSFINATSTIPTNIAIGIWTLYLLVFGAGIVYFRKKVPQLILLAAVFLLPLLTEVVLSFWRPSFSESTLLWTTIPLFLILAAGVSQAKFRPLIIVTIGILGALNFFAVSDYFRFYQKEDWTSAARAVAGHAEKGDLILFTSNLNEIPFDYYFIPYQDLYAIEIEKRGVPRDLTETGAVEPVMTEADIPDLNSLIQGHDRVWLVYSNESAADPSGLVPQTLSSGMNLAEKENFYGGQVQLYIRQ
jgi:uncharacterized membrane protein